MRKLEIYDLKFKLFDHINDNSSSLDFTQNNDTDLIRRPYVKDNLLIGKERKKIDKTVYEVEFDNKIIAFFVLSSSIIFENNKDKIDKKDHNNPFFVFY